MQINVFLRKKHKNVPLSYPGIVTRYSVTVLKTKTDTRPLWSSFRNSANVKSLLSFVFSIDFLGDKFYIIVEAEDAGHEQEGLGNIDQQTAGHIVNHDYLISHQCDTAHNEQHRTGILRNFETIFTFHSS